MQQEYRLKKRKDYRLVYRFGYSMANRQLVIFCMKRPHGTAKKPFRLGISVSRKVGNAVTRNRIRRMIKEAVRQWNNDLKPGIDIVIIARRPTATMNYGQMASSLRHILKRARCFHTLPDEPYINRM